MFHEEELHSRDTALKFIWPELQKRGCLNAVRTCTQKHCALFPWMCRWINHLEFVYFHRAKPIYYFISRSVKIKEDPYVTYIEPLGLMHNVAHHCWCSDSIFSPQCHATSKCSLCVSEETWSHLIQGLKKSAEQRLFCMCVLKVSVPVLVLAWCLKLLICLRTWLSLTFMWEVQSSSQ